MSKLSGIMLSHCLFLERSGRNFLPVLDYLFQIWGATSLIGTYQIGLEIRCMYCMYIFVVYCVVNVIVFFKFDKS